MEGDPGMGEDPKLEIRLDEPDPEEAALPSGWLAFILVSLLFPCNHYPPDVRLSTSLSHSSFCTSLGLILLCLALGTFHRYFLSLPSTASWCLCIFSVSLISVLSFTASSRCYLHLTQYLPLTVSILLLPLLLTFIVLSGESVQVEMHALPRRVVRVAVAGQLFLGAGVPWYVSGGPQVSGSPAEWRCNGQYL